MSIYVCRLVSVPKRSVGTAGCVVSCLKPSNQSWHVLFPLLVLCVIRVIGSLLMELSQLLGLDGVLKCIHAVCENMLNGHCIG